MKMICEFADRELNVCKHNYTCNHGKIHEQYEHCRELSCMHASKMAKCMQYQPFKDEIERILEF
jgi:hypothetical protein